METKEVKIQVPEGYEIDKEKSTFECVKFKHMNKNITYEDVCDTIFKNDYCYFIDEDGGIYLYTTADKNNPDPNKLDPNNAPNDRQLKRLLALNKLFNIAVYYNTKVEILCDLYLICYNTIKEEYEIVCNDSEFRFGSHVCFYRKEDAQLVIDNPNFREILDTIYKY